jgi:3-polyprenyl-4-hydroxybenzoate decarboxylase
MRRLTYAGLSVNTGDEIAELVLEYARVLANAQLAATVDVPVRAKDGSIEQVELLVGPASQITSEPAHGVGDELIDREASAKLRRLIEPFRRPGASQALPKQTDDYIEDL